MLAIWALGRGGFQNSRGTVLATSDDIHVVILYTYDMIFIHINYVTHTSIS